MVLGNTVQIVTNETSWDALFRFAKWWVLARNGWTEAAMRTRERGLIKTEPQRSSLLNRAAPHCSGGTVGLAGRCADKGLARFCSCTHGAFSSSFSNWHDTLHMWTRRSATHQRGISQHPSRSSPGAAPASYIVRGRGQRGLSSCLPQ